jgi:hypothetical protein
MRPTAAIHYLRKLNGDAAHDAPLMRALGAADAAANARGHRYLVLLDIGGQFDGGVRLTATTIFVSYSDLVAAIEAYLDGYIAKQRYNAPALLALGTNNDGIVSKARGQIWAQDVVAPVAAYARRSANRLGRTITVSGANDIEPGFSATPGQTSAWLAGHAEVDLRRSTHRAADLHPGRLVLIHQ